MISIFECNAHQIVSAWTVGGQSNTKTNLRRHINRTNTERKDVEEGIALHIALHRQKHANNSIKRGLFGESRRELHYVCGTAE